MKHAKYNDILFILLNPLIDALRQMQETPNLKQ